MPAGLQIFNEGGVIQVDEDYRNYHYLGLTYVEASAPFSQSPNYFYTDVTFYDVNRPLIGFVNTDFAFYVMLSRNGNAATYRFFRRGRGGMNIIRFDMVDVPVNNVGFQVFNGAGQLVFDAGRKYLRVIDTRYVDTTNGISGEPSISYGRQIGVIQARRAFNAGNYPTDAGNSPMFLTVYLSSYFRASGDNLTYGFNSVGADGPSNSPPGIIGGSNRFMALLVVDMTNYL